MAERVILPRQLLVIPIARLRLFGVFLFCCFASVASAAQFTWTGAGGDNYFHNSANWNPAAVPNSGDDLVFPPLLPPPSTNNVDLILVNSRNFASWTVSGQYWFERGQFEMSGPMVVTPGARSVFSSTIVFTASPLIQSAGTFDSSGNETNGYIMNSSGQPLVLDTPAGGTIDIGYLWTGQVVKIGGGFARIAETRFVEVTVNDGTMASSGSFRLIADMDLPVTVNSPAIFCEGTSLASLTIRPGATLDTGCPDGSGVSGIQTKVLTLEAAAQAVFDLEPLVNDRIFYRERVDLGVADLVVRADFVPPVGTQFKLIEAEPQFGMDGVINGTFAGLPEGAEFEADGIRYRITYAGGPYANNVELTVVSTPAGCEPPATPQITGPSVVSSGVLYGLNWSATSPDGRYELRESTAPSFAGAAPVVVTTPSALFQHEAQTPTTYYYSVRAERSCPAGLVYSSPAFAQVVVTPCTLPSILEQPRARTRVSRGSNVTLEVRATAPDPLAYQWYVGPPGDISQPIPGAMAPAVTIRPAVTSSYWVQVSNSCGAVVSEAAQVIVTGRRRTANR